MRWQHKRVTILDPVHQRWKAFRCPDQAADCYAKAKQELKDIIDSNTYELSSNFATNWDPAGFWNKECIWAMCSDEGNQWSSWGSDRTIDNFNPNMMKWFCACPENDYNDQNTCHSFHLQPSYPKHGYEVR